MGNIEWKDLLDGSFIKLENGVPKLMVLQNWRMQDKFKDEKTGELRPGVTFDCIDEDENTCEKTWTVTAIRALAKLRPIIEKAEAESRDKITVKVIRAGEGRKTVYEINEM